MKMFYDKDADMSILKDKTIAIIGFGSQGHAQAQNLRDSGFNVIVSEVEDTDNYKFAIDAGFKPLYRFLFLIKFSRKFIIMRSKKVSNQVMHLYFRMDSTFILVR